MEEKLITIIINNYNGKKITYTASENALVDIWNVMSITGPNKNKVTNITIELMDSNGIDKKEEDIN